MQERLFDFQYKGGRGYIHGTDIFNHMMVWLMTEEGDVADVDVAFHRLAVRQLRAVPGVLPEGAEPVAVCAYTARGVRERVAMIETDQPVTGRYDYPEDEIVKEMQVDPVKRQGGLTGNFEFSRIEILVAMTKALHYKVFPHLKGKWLFVRGRFPRPLNDGGGREYVLTIASSFNDKLTRSVATVDGVKVGEIYFSIV